MSAGGPGPLRILSFGVADGSVWGSAIEADQSAIVFHTPHGNAAATGPDQVRFEAETERWRLSGAGFDFAVTPLGHRDRAGRPLPVSDELCRVEGRLSANGAELSVDCAATRSVQETVPARGTCLRALAGWFEGNRGILLRSLRPAGSKGQDRDQVSATVFDPEEWIPVADPRLSTTYRHDVQPDRASLELWIGPGDEQYPRRAAAEASGPALGARGGSLQVEVTPLHCHSGGLDGTGIYLIAHL